MNAFVYSQIAKLAVIVNPTQSYKMTNPKTKILFAHSGGPQDGPGEGSYDLVKYLKSSLQERFQVLFPIIEDASSPTYAKFKDLFKLAFAEITEPVILVGHSLGGSTLLKYLSEEKPDVSILGLFLISTPFWKSNMKDFQLKENFQASLKDIPQIFLYHSKKDTAVSIDHLEFYENAFKTAVVHKLNGSEHAFSKGLPELVADIKSLDI
jgi:predicted alpha/beta hydrolase family esterase